MDYSKIKRSDIRKVIKDKGLHLYSKLCENSKIVYKLGIVEEDGEITNLLTTTSKATLNQFIIEY